MSANAIANDMRVFNDKSKTKLITNPQNGTPGWREVVSGPLAGQLEGVLWFGSKNKAPENNGWKTPDEFRKLRDAESQERGKRCVPRYRADDVPDTFPR